MSIRTPFAFIGAYVDTHQIPFFFAHTINPFEGLLFLHKAGYPFFINAPGEHAILLKAEPTKAPSATERIASQFFSLQPVPQKNRGISRNLFDLNDLRDIRLAAWSGAGYDQAFRAAAAEKGLGFLGQWAAVHRRSTLAVDKIA